MIKNWKTTSTGILMIIGGISRFLFAMKSNNYTEESIMSSMTLIVGGIGFILTKDHDVTGGDLKQ